MSRGLHLVFGCLAAMTVGASAVGAQYYNYPGGVGYAGGGFGGFGGTVGGDVARGMGAYAAGAGVYNRDTAVANSVNANTIMRVNEYLYQSQQLANVREQQRLARRQARVNAAQETAQESVVRIRDNPTESDIESGAAMNAILDQLTDPKIFSGSTLRLANATVDAKVIRDIPFRDATDAITITLGQLTSEKSWPAPLLDPKLDAERHAYIAAVEEALKEDAEGDLSPATVQKVRQAVSDLNRRVGETIPVTRQPDHLQAVNYLKGLAGFSKMLQRSNFQEVLGELEKLETTTVGHLLAFMHNYNLRFDEAETASQRTAYQKLYPIMANTREKLIGKPAAEPAQAKGADEAGKTQENLSPGEIFFGLDPQHLNDTPPRPQPPAAEGAATKGQADPN